MKPTRDEQAFAEMLDGLRHDAPEEMARMARLAQALEHVRPTTGPEPAFRNALRNRLIAEAAVRRSWIDRAAERWTERNLTMRRNLRVVFATAVAAAVLLAGGSIFAVAATSVPGDWTYWAKKARENAHLLVTRAPEARAYLEMEYARERLDEVRALVNRSQDSENPYFTALNDMDAKTLDATRLLIGVYSRSHHTFALDRLAQFAVAQRHGLEVLVERLPPGARPPARDSIDILQRVSDRVVGIIGGCLCPANALLPKVSSGQTSTSPVNGPIQAPVCACSRFRGEDPTSQAAGSGDGTTGPPPSGPQPTPTQSPGPIDSLTGTVNDNTTQTTDAVNDLIDSTLGDTLLGPIVGPSPVKPLPSIPQIGQ